MRPKKHKTTGSNDLFRARLDQIINMKHELVLLAGRVPVGRSKSPGYGHLKLPHLMIAVSAAEQQ